jgi:hypothetical protein
MTTNEFRKLVDSIDWFYEFLDGNDYLDERNKYEQIKKISERNEEFTRIFNNKFFEVFKR